MRRSTDRSAFGLFAARTVPVALAATLLLAGCSAGQVSQTATKDPTVDGINAAVGTIQIRDLSIVRPEGDETVWEPGSDVPLSFRLVNEGPADELVQVLVVQAQGVSIRGGGATPSGGPSASVSPSGSPSASVSASVSPSGSPSAAVPPSTGASASVPPSEGAVPADCAETVDVAVPERDLLVLDPADGPHVVLCSITEEIRVGRTVSVTMVFAEAGQIRLEVPMETPGEPLERETSEGED